MNRIEDREVCRACNGVGYDIVPGVEVGGDGYAIPDRRCDACGGNGYVRALPNRGSGEPVPLRDEWIVAIRRYENAKTMRIEGERAERDAARELERMTLTLEPGTTIEVENLRITRLLGAVEGNDRLKIERIENE